MTKSTSIKIPGVSKIPLKVNFRDHPVLFFGNVIQSTKSDFQSRGILQTTLHANVLFVYHLQPHILDLSDKKS
jgi:hypothetical protein